MIPDDERTLCCVPDGKTLLTLNRTFGTITAYACKDCYIFFFDIKIIRNIDFKVLSNLPIIYDIHV